MNINYDTLHLEVQRQSEWMLELSYYLAPDYSEPADSQRQLLEQDDHPREGVLRNG